MSRRPRIALCVMVKNEAKTLPRLLDSVIGIADAVIAFDTGSTDSTLDILKSVDAQILQGEFEDFGKSRTKLMEFAHGKADWLLLMDADHILRKEAPELRLDTAFDGFLLEHAGSLKYSVCRLVKGDVPWKFVGATHEYLCRADHKPSLTSSLEGLRIGHMADGGSRSDKFERDERLLRASYAEDPTNVRTVFYLANTLRDVGKKEEALEMFNKRAGMGGWDEEAFVARLEAAKLSHDPLKFWEAWVTRPTRAEPLYYLEKLYNRRKEFAKAWDTLRIRREIAIPEKDILFVERPCYADPLSDG